MQENIVIGASSIVTKNLKDSNSIYAGNPAKFIKKVIPLSKEDKLYTVNYIVSEYKKIAKYHGISPGILVNYPIICVNNCKFDVEKLEFEGNENEETDDFRDYVRKWGLRFYSDRPFRSVYENKF